MAGSRTGNPGRDGTEGHGQEVRWTHRRRELRHGRWEMWGFGGVVVFGWCVCGEVPGTEF